MIDHDLEFFMKSTSYVLSVAVAVHCGTEIIM